MALVLLTGCSGRPSVQDVEPAMRQAVRTVVGGEAPVRREVLPLCGPGDERLDGLLLQLHADVPAGSVDLDDAAADLRRTGVDVVVPGGGGGGGAPLLTVDSGDGWTADLWPTTDGRWRFTASGEVDDDGAAAAGVLRPCG